MGDFLPENLKQELLSIKRDDLTYTFISINFGYHGGKNKDGKLEVYPPKFPTDSKVRLKKGEWLCKKDNTITGVGVILFNKIYVEDRFERFFPDGWYNVIVTKKKFISFYEGLSRHVRNGEVDIEKEWIPFLKDYEFWSLKGVSIFSGSYSMNIIKPNEKVIKAKEELLKEAGELTDMKEMVQIEDKLTKLAKSEVGNDPAFPLYASGARGSFDNDYKNISIALGPVKNASTGEYKYVKHNYIDGMEKEDLVSMGNVIITSSLPKSVETRDSGYNAKKFYALFQDVTLGEKGSDCHSKVTLDVTLDEDSIDDYMYQYMVEENKLVELTDDIAPKYIGKKVKLRSPMYCLSPDCTCNACAGERFYRLEMENPGLTAVRGPNTLLNAKMKVRHNTKIVLSYTDPDTLLM